MPSSMHARNLLSLPCPVGTKPTFPWRQSSRTACYKILPLLATKPMIAPPSDRQRPPRELKPAFLVARTGAMGGDGDRIEIAEPSNKRRAVEMLLQQTD